MVTQTKEVLESYIFSTSRRSVSIYSERLLIRIIEVAQRQLSGVNFRDGVDIGQVSIGSLGDARLEIPIRNLLGPGNTNYTQAKRAIVELMRSPYFIERQKFRGGEPVLDDNGKPVFELVGHQILNDCEVNVKPGVAIINVNENTWKGILDFSKGFRKVDLNAILSLSKVCSVRMLCLVSNQRTPFTFSIRSLREMWGMEDKYPDTSDFLRRTVEPAKAELDEKAPWSFTYVRNYNVNAEVNRGRRGKKSITSITVYPVQKIVNMSTSGLLGMVGSPVAVLGRPVYDLLLTKFQFTPQGIKNNLVTFEAARRAGMDVETFLYSIAPNALRATNPPGYVIRSVDQALKEDYGVTKTPEGYVFG